MLQITATYYRSIHRVTNSCYVISVGQYATMSAPVEVMN